MTAAYPPFLQNDPRFEAIGDVVREKLVFNAGGSASCHATPGQNDRLKIGGGLALASPFGTFRPPNISPDPIDGIGKWSAADLANAQSVGSLPTAITRTCLTVPRMKPASFRSPFAGD